MKTLIYILIAVASYNLMAMEQTNPCLDQELVTVKSNNSYPKVLKRFKRKGGMEKDIIQVKSIEDILTHFNPQNVPEDFAYRIVNPHRLAYKYTIDTRCNLMVFRHTYRAGQTDPSKKIPHHVLAYGDYAFTAGAIYFFHNQDHIQQVVVSNESFRFCSSQGSLEIVKKLLLEMGLDESQILLVHAPNPNCTTVNPLTLNP